MSSRIVKYLSLAGATLFRMLKSALILVVCFYSPQPLPAQPIIPLDFVRTIGMEVFLSFAYSLLAEAYVRAERVQEGLQAVNEGLVFVKESGERLHEAELHRWSGELLSLRGSNESEIEGELQTAIRIAREQNAKSLELRASMSLARLWKGGGRREEAYQKLNAVYSWFTEGFETRDLREAKALLDELSSAAD